MYVGLDVGSFQTKICYCGDRTAQTLAWPTDSVMLRQEVSSPASSDRPALDQLGRATQVPVDGVPFAVYATSEFVDHRVTSNLVRSAHLREFRAVALAALARVPSERIESLTLGLPFLPFIGHPACSSLTSKLRGKHEVGTRTLRIDRIHVVPQGFGAFIALTNMPKRVPSIYDITLVVDVGYSCVSWLLAQDGCWYPKRAGASLDGVSFIQRAVGRELCGRACAERPMDGNAHSVVPRIDMSNGSLEAGELTALVKRVHVAGAVRRMKDALLNADAVTEVMWTGGGASFYEKELRLAFPHARKVTCANPILTNVVGLCRLAPDVAKM